MTGVTATVAVVAAGGIVISCGTPTSPRPPIATFTPPLRAGASSVMVAVVLPPSVTSAGLSATVFTSFRNTSTTT
jgi:hypothetical protein